MDYDYGYGFAYCFSSVSVHRRPGSTHVTSVFDETSVTLNGSETGREATEAVSA